MKLTRLQQRLGYSFKNQALLIRALTHRSHGADHNERLEFLGDSILNFVVADLLCRALSSVSEGDLSRIRASLVNQSSLAALAQEIELSSCLRLGEGELKSGGFKRPSILADAMEAIIAAAYLDGGMENAHALVSRLYEPLISKLDPKTAGKDDKTLLQESLQKHQLALPRYEISDILGEAHNQEFIVGCLIPELGIATQSTGTSRRQAEQKAAHLALKQIAEAGGVAALSRQAKRAGQS